MKITIDADEWYPVYSIRDDYGYEVEADPDDVARWKAAEEAFDAAQTEMGELYDAAREIASKRAAEEKAAKEAAVRAEAERKRREAEEARIARRQAEEEMQRKLDASGGAIFDSNGSQIGVIRNGRVEPA